MKMGARSEDEEKKPRSVAQEPKKEGGRREDEGDADARSREKKPREDARKAKAKSRAQEAKKR